MIRNNGVNGDVRGVCLVVVIGPSVVRGSIGGDLGHVQYMLVVG